MSSFSNTYDYPTRNGVLAFLKGPLSQWYRKGSTFSDLGRTYCCMEQYMMARKAAKFYDTDTELQILDTTDPAEHKRLGRLVKNFVQREWDQSKYRIVLEGNLLKFSSNDVLREILARTGDNILVEANPRDNIWGCATDETDDRTYDPLQWQGLNLLGRVLMEVRHQLCCAPIPKIALHKVGDVVAPYDHARPLRSGASAYSAAVVASTDPFVLISPHGDMRWQTTINPLYFRNHGQASKGVQTVVRARFDRDELRTGGVVAF